MNADIIIYRSIGLFLSGPLSCFLLMFKKKLLTYTCLNSYVILEERIKELLQLFALPLISAEQENKPAVHASTPSTSINTYMIKE